MGVGKYICLLVMFLLASAFVFATDQYEDDDTYQNASWIEVDGTLQRHSITPAADYDWIKFNATEGMRYTLETFNPENNTDTVMTLYYTDSVTPIVENDDKYSGIDIMSSITFYANTTGTFYARVKEFNAGDSGVAYSVSVTQVGTLVPYTITEAKDVLKGSFFTFSTGVTCVGGYCNNVTATLDPKPIVAQSKVVDTTESIKLNSRTITPEQMWSVAEELTQQSGSAYLIIQFTCFLDEQYHQLLNRLGVKLFHYIPDNAWFASIPAKNIESVYALPFVNWIGKIQPNDKTSEVLRTKIVSQQLTAQSTEEEYFTVMFFEDVSLDDAQSLLLSKGANIAGRSKLMNAIVIKAPTSIVLTLQHEDSIMWIEEARLPRTGYNDGSRVGSGVNIINVAPYHLNGSGTRAAEWDAGCADPTHDDLENRTFCVDGAATHSHSTHVAGTMLGDGSRSVAEGGTDHQWRGMAPLANLSTYEWWDDVVELEEEYISAIVNYSVDVSQNSWGLNIGAGSCSIMGDYRSQTYALDKVVRGDYADKKLPVVWSAGNDRNDGDCGTDPGNIDNNFACVPPYGTAKNSIVVGAINSDTGTMTTFSSWGPLDDGRIKPDIVAPGDQVGGDTAIVSTEPGNTYSLKVGTSMAAPVVSGVILLMTQQFNTRGIDSVLPSTYKAILVHTADEHNNSGPDYTSGYGRLNATNAIDMILNDTPSVNLIHEDVITEQYESDHYTITVGTEAELKVTLVWDDLPAIPNADPTLINDLDLILISPNNTRFYPLTLNHSNISYYNDYAEQDEEDHINVIEQINVTSPAAGTWNLYVNGTTIPFGSQTYTVVSDLHLTQISKGVIPMHNGTPFYTNDTNPRNDSCLASMSSGESCNQTWTINATGVVGTYEFFSIYDFDVNFNNSETNITSTVNITIKDIIIDNAFCYPDPNNSSNITFCNATVSSYEATDTVMANVTLPNGSVRLAVVSNSGRNYSFNFSETSVGGGYSVQWWSNDTLGNLDVASVSFSIVDNNIEGSVVGNSTIINSTIADSTVQWSNISHSTVNLSFVDPSTIIHSDVLTSNITDSTVDMCSVNNSELFDVYVNHSDIVNSTINFSINVTFSLIVGSNLTNSTVINSTILYSNKTNTESVVSTLFNATLTNSTGRYSNVSCSIILASNLTTVWVNSSSVVTCSNLTTSTVVSSTIFTSQELNSNATGSVVFDSTVANSTVVNSTVNLSFVDPSTIINSTIDNSNITNSTIIECTVINSVKINVYMFRSTNINSTVLDCNETYSNVTSTVANGSNLTNSTILDSFVYNSLINFSNVTNSSINSSNVSMSNITDSYVNGSNIYNATIVSSVIINSTIGNTTIIGLTIINDVLVPMSAVADISIVQNSDYSVNLTWSQVPGVQGYVVYYDENASKLIELADSPAGTANVTILGVTQTNFTDYEVSNLGTRFYRVGTYFNLARNISTVVSGKFSVPVEIGLNLVSTPFNLSYKALTQVATAADPLRTSPSESLSAVYRFNASRQLFEKADYLKGYGWYSSNTENMTSIESGMGYAVMATARANITLTGSTPSVKSNVSLAKGFNLVGYSLPAVMSLGAEAVSRPVNVSVTNAVNTLYKFRWPGLYEKSDYFSGYGWENADGLSENFTTMDPGVGYWMRTLQPCGYSN